jgi:hypothetical protein
MALLVTSSLLEITVIQNNSVLSNFFPGNDADKLYKKTDLLKLKRETFVSSKVVLKQDRSCEYIVSMEAGSAMILSSYFIS